MTSQAVHFGAGSIGRGFLGQIYCESGFHTTFIDVVEPVVEAINARGAYPLHIVDDDREATIHIDNISAVNGTDHEAAASALARADIGSTAVGLNALPHIVPVIATAIEMRFKQPDAAPLNIILCENLNDGEAYVRELVAKHLAPAYLPIFENAVGIIEASVGRMVPVMTQEQREEDLLAVWVEPYCKLPVDAAGFRGDIPQLKYLAPAADFEAYVERKLFVHNLTHAATAYLGYRRGHTYIYEAIRDDEVREAVEAAGSETCAALAKKHGIPAEDLRDHLLDLIHRYHNRALADQVVRVARDPMRKLGPEDRLVGALRLCTQFDDEPRAVAHVAAAAVLYDNPEDEAATKLQNLLRNDGMDAVLRDVCGLSLDSSEAALIRKAVQELSHIEKE